MEIKHKAVILANGEYPTHPTPLAKLMQAQFVVCCDGGADQYIANGFTPDVIVGDGDSLSAENREKFANLIHYIPDQETNDQTKAVKYLLEQGHREIAIVGATGKREDHTIGNISLLIEYMRMGAQARIYTDYGVFIPCSGNQRFASHKGQQVSIFNFTAKNLSSNGLEYPIYTFTSWWQGTLNNSLGEEFSIEADGEYIIFLNYA
ncbi:MAG: thiamine diphosphokinase [Alistipes sp.]|nr:thiamine diphosphokinase [Alistipes sp.]